MFQVAKNKALIHAFTIYVLDFPLAVAKSNEFSSHSVEVQVQNYKKLGRYATDFRIIHRACYENVESVENIVC